MWDITAIRALDKVVAKLRHEGKEIAVTGLSEVSGTLVDEFAIHGEIVEDRLEGMGEDVVNPATNATWVCHGRFLRR